MVRAISVYSAGVPYAALFTAAVKIPLPFGYVSVQEFVLIESYLKAISSNTRTMDQTKSIELQKKRLEIAEERARARAPSACAQTR